MEAGDRQPNPKDFYRASSGTRRSCERGCETADTEGEEEEVAPFLAGLTDSCEALLPVGDQGPGLRSLSPQLPKPQPRGVKERNRGRGGREETGAHFTP